jgi:hypothetical protein
MVLLHDHIHFFQIHFLASDVHIRNQQLLESFIANQLIFFPAKSADAFHYVSFNILREYGYRLPNVNFGDVNEPSKVKGDFKNICRVCICRTYIDLFKTLLINMGVECNLCALLLLDNLLVLFDVQAGLEEIFNLSFWHCQQLVILVSHGLLNSFEPGLHDKFKTGSIISFSFVIIFFGTKSSQFLINVSWNRLILAIIRRTKAQYGVIHMAQSLRLLTLGQQITLSSKHTIELFSVLRHVAISCARYHKYQQLECLLLLKVELGAVEIVSFNALEISLIVSIFIDGFQKVLRDAISIACLGGKKHKCFDCVSFLHD